MMMKMMVKMMIIVMTMMMIDEIDDIDCSNMEINIFRAMLFP